jgi:hypothetical protein
LARIHFLQGQPGKATQFQTQAVAAAGEDASDKMKKVLEEYQKQNRYR